MCSSPLPRSSRSHIRPLTSADIPAALVLSAASGWNQIPADWNLLLQSELCGMAHCLGMECDGCLVATTTLICYGDQLAWLGMVLTHPEYRRRGFARSLVERALSIADSRNIRCVKLDATDQGQALYSSLGFRDEQVIQRWSGPGLCTYPPDLLPSGLPDWILDRAAFAADRSPILKHLAEARPFLRAAGGFAHFRAGAVASYLGPCVAGCTESARLLIESCLSSGSQHWYWDLLPSDPAAVAIASELQFQPLRTLLRMYRGTAVRGDDSMIYAIGGFELG